MVDFLIPEEQAKKFDLHSISRFVESFSIVTSP
jgi:hypothetical protein